MADSKRPRETSKSDANEIWNPLHLFALNRSAFDCWMRGVSAYTQEMSEFLASRLTNDFTALTTLSSCKTAEQAYECQRQFIENATQAYIEEANKLSHLTISIANETFSAFQVNAAKAGQLPAE